MKKIAAIQDRRSFCQTAVLAVTAEMLIGKEAAAHNSEKTLSGP